MTGGGAAGLFGAGFIMGSANTGMAGGSFGEAMLNGVVTGAISGISAGVGSAAGGFVGSKVSGIASPVLREAITGASKGLAAGFTAGTLGGLATGQDVGEALGTGLKAGAIGGGLGAGFGAINGVRQHASMKKNYFKDGKYNYESRQAGKMANRTDDYHGFSKHVDDYAAKYGKLRIITGGDGISRSHLFLDGTLTNSRGNVIRGTFEYIKNPNGDITHRFFQSKILK